MEDMTRRQNLQVILYGILFLFFFQLIADFVEAIYAFGLLGTSIPPEIVSVLFFFSPLLLRLLPRGLSGWPLVLVGEVMLVSRVVEALLDTRGRILVSGLGVACFLLILPALLWNQEEREAGFGGLILGLGLTLGISLSVLFRALGSGSDISISGWSQAIGWILALIAGALLLKLRTTEQRGTRMAPSQSSAWETAGLCLGWVGVLVLGYFALTSPNVIARWTGESYLLIVSVVALVLGLFALLLMARPDLLAALSPKVALVGNALFVLALVTTILGHQIGFPTVASAYPLPEPPPTLLHPLPLFLMLLLSPIILIDVVLFSRQLVTSKPSFRALGGGFSLSAVYLVFIIFAQVFTTVYDYIPVVGPLFRDKFWFVFLLAGIVATLPVLLVRRESFESGRALSRLRLGRAFAGLVVLVVLATVTGAFLTAARPAPVPRQQTALRIVTYNIQQGYNQDGLKNYDGQLGLLRGMDADIIGLQESDTNRIAGGNADVVRYFADRLALYSYYGPKTVVGTFGIALLSRYPIENPRTFYMYSEGEQTAAIEAQIRVGGETFQVFVTHLGNGGPMVQQEAVLQEVQGRENVLLLGDFNFRPDSEQYQLTTSLLADSWLLKWPQGNDSQGVDPADRIDYIFVSPGTRVEDARYLPGPQSDHPAMMTIVEW